MYFFAWQQGQRTVAVLDTGHDATKVCHPSAAMPAQLCSLCVLACTEVVCGALLSQQCAAQMQTQLAPCGLRAPSQDPCMPCRRHWACLPWWAACSTSAHTSLALRGD